MICLQLTANTGPVECCLAVRKALAVLMAEALAAAVDVRLVEQLDGPAPGTLRSVLLELDDPARAGADGLLARQWSGSILWVCDSPYRTLCKRKNWFLGGNAFVPPQASADDGAIRYEATRASGPGGQHVNKTDSAIRATHVVAETQQEKGKSARRLHHSQTERGNAVRVFVGPGFIERT